MNSFNNILHWYNNNKRDLPWRKNKNPYQIWLSEIILQQTRVAQGLPYYERFIEEYPTVEDFASASIDEILHIWQGLGYYSRGRNMHFAANQVVNNYNGVFPDNFKELKSLKGVGDYTAAAIASIAFKEKVAVVDGNVYRVLSRFFNDSTPIDSLLGKKRFALLANEVLDKTNPGDHNQAIMEIGALVCKPSNPLCDVCPLQNGCEGFENKTFDNLPIKDKKIKVRERFFHYFFIDAGAKTYIEQRTSKDIWYLLYQFPLIEKLSNEELTKNDVFTLSSDLNLEKLILKATFNHKLTHQKITAHFYEISNKALTKIPNHWLEVERNELETFAFPKLIINYLQEMNKN